MSDRKSCRETPEAWRAFAGGFAWPTVLLTLAVLVSFAAVATSVVAGALPLAAGFLANTIVAYVAFTPAHEATHWNIAGRNSALWWVNEACGWLGMSVLFDNFAVLRAAHLQHHAHTNEADRDPDYFEPGVTFLQACARGLTLYHAYINDYLDETARKPGTVRRRTLHGSWSGLLIVTAIGLALAGWWREVLFLWVLPAGAAFVVLAVAFDWVPHRPHTVAERFRDTRIILAPGLEALMLGQNYHLIHHLYPSIPFYRYRPCFEAMQDELRARGAPIGRPGRMFVGDQPLKEREGRARAR
jgi:beta-carotene hydroxylase